MENAGELVEVVATVDSDLMDRLAQLEERVSALEEMAKGQVSAAAATAAGRRTLGVGVMAKGEAQVQAGSVDRALESLSVEQRVAVKAGLLRAGLL
jgi:pyridoxine 5'-phosphate synthase PdxJ